VAIALSKLPKYMVLEPSSTLRLDMHLDEPACEIDVSLDNPRPGRSFVLLIGHPGGPFVQRVRLAGRARIYFDPESPGDYVLMFANPDAEPIVLRVRGRGVGRPTIKVKRTSAKRRGPGRGKTHRTNTGRSRDARAFRSHRAR
jgi:hypothetical protein